MSYQEDYEKLTPEQIQTLIAEYKEKFSDIPAVKKRIEEISGEANKLLVEFSNLINRKQEAEREMKRDLRQIMRHILIHTDMPHPYTNYFAESEADSQLKRIIDTKAIIDKQELEKKDESPPF